jgi:hypothetical protein
VPVAGAGPLAVLAPALAAASAGCAALLVPGFAGGMALAPLAELLLIGALLGLAEVLRVAALLDSADAAGGLAAARLLGLAPLAVAAWLLLALAMALLAGGSNLDAALGVLRETPAGLPWLLLLGALGALALAPGEAALPEASGRDLALWQLHAGLRAVTLAGLLGALAWPWSVAGPGLAPLAWPLGVAAWAVKLGLFALLLALAGLFPRGRAVQWLGAALLLAGLAAALLAIAGAPA